MGLKEKCFKLIDKKKKKETIDLNNTKKILFIRHDRIGDMIVTSFLFREIKKAYPEIQIDVLASPKNKSVLKYNPFVKNVYTYDKKPVNTLKTILRIRKNKYDIITVVYELNSFTTTLMLRLFKGRVNIGFFPNFTQLLDYYIVKDYHNDHVTEKYREILKMLNISNYSLKYDFYFGADEKRKAEVFMDTLITDKSILFNRYGSSKSRTIDEKASIEIIRYLLNKYDDYSVILAHTKSNYDDTLKLVEEINNPKVVLCCQTETILEMGAIISKADILITIDTSLVHIGGAFNIPTIALYSPDIGNYKRWHSISDINETVFSKTLEDINMFDIQEFKNKIDYVVNIAN